jgi:hypothetical protein
VLCLKMSEAVPLHFGKLTCSWNRSITVYLLVSHVSPVVMFLLLTSIQDICIFCLLQNGDWILMAQKTVPLTVVWNYGIMETSDLEPQSHQNRYTANRE